MLLESCDYLVQELRETVHFQLEVSDARFKRGRSLAVLRNLTLLIEIPE
jgi:hypothetical protein